MLLFRSFELVSQETHPDTTILFVDHSDSTLSALILEQFYDLPDTFFRRRVVVHDHVVVLLDPREYVPLVDGRLAFEVATVYLTASAEALSQDVLVSKADEAELHIGAELLDHRRLGSEERKYQFCLRRNVAPMLHHWDGMMVHFTFKAKVCHGEEVSKLTTLLKLSS